MQIDQVNIRILFFTRKHFLYSIGLALVGIIIIFAIIVPQIQAAYSAYGQLNKEKPKTESLRVKLANLNSLVTSPEYAQVEVVEAALPSKKPLLELLMSVSTVSKETGIDVEKFQLNPGLVATDSTKLEKTAGSNINYDSLSIDIEVKGTFAQIQDFFLKMEQISPFTTVTNMQITGDLGDAAETTTPSKATPKPSGPPEFSATITTETFFYTQQLAVKIDSQLPALGTPEHNVLAALASFIPTTVPAQTEIVGGGLEDLFGVQSNSSAEKVNSVLESGGAITPSLLGSEALKASQQNPSSAAGSSTGTTTEPTPRATAEPTPRPTAEPTTQPAP